MIESKKINILIAISLVFALVVSILFVVVANTQEANIINTGKAEYITKIFGSDIISVEIIADEAQWQEMLDNAINEQYIMADVIVNGTKFQSVGIRPKGNSSLTQVASSDSDRYSFRLQFDEYIKGQTCFGLESFVVNNMLGDNTYMKEYVSYDLMKEIGVDAPCFGFADIKVNDENWGLYLAVELYNESYEQRVFNDISGMLYNVKSMDMGGNMGDNQPNRQNNNMRAMSEMEGGENTRFQRPNGESQERTSNELPKSINGEDRSVEGRNMEDRFPGMGGDMGRGSGGGSLEYTDDNVESYGSIFNNVVGKGTEKDYKRVIEALKNLSEGNNLEEYFDVDQILRYLAAHTIVVNLDSYSSSMAQNYYVYENNGKITILPWDYNLAWGGFQSGDASSVINFPIDTPVSGVEMPSRPLIEKLFENPEYLNLYHSYLQQLMDEYFANGKFEEKINTLDTLISDYVKNDNTAFCTYEEYKKAVSSFITLGNLRAKSIQGQLHGTVHSTTEDQKADADNLVSAGDLNLSDLGSMMGGRGGNEGFGGMDRNGGKPSFGNLEEIEIPSGMELPADMELPNMRQEGRIELQEEMRGNPTNSIVPNSDIRQNLGKNNLIQISLLLFVLIIATIFVARYKKDY